MRLPRSTPPFPNIDLQFGQEMARVAGPRALTDEEKAEEEERIRKVCHL